MNKIHHGQPVWSSPKRAYLGVRVVSKRQAAQSGPAVCDHDPRQRLEKERGVVVEEIQRLRARRDLLLRELEAAEQRLWHIDSQLASGPGDADTQAGGDGPIPPEAVQMTVIQHVAAAWKIPVEECQGMTFDHQFVRSRSGKPGTLVACFAARGGGRISVAFGLGIAAEAGTAPQLLWGLSSRTQAAWRDPPAGWTTQPPRSTDAGTGAWYTKCELGPALPGASGSISTFQVLLEFPAAGSVASERGLAFKFNLESGDWVEGRKKGNLFVPIPDALLDEAITQSGSLPSPGQSADGKSDNGAEGGEEAAADVDDVDLLARLSPAEADVLRVAPRDKDTLGPVPAGPLTLESALNPQSQDAPDSVWPSPLCRSTVAFIKGREHEAERSLMHRYNLAADLLDQVALPNAATLAEHLAMRRGEALLCSLPTGAAGARPDRPEADGDVRRAGAAESAVMGVAMWLRFAGARLLVWNRNYNVKPREISAAQDRLTSTLSKLWEQQPWMRSTLRVALGAVGRGGQGNMGQRIRDEILAIQSRNNCKGGMMEQWHQKLHNNTTPDDVHLCRALIAYIDAGLDICAYWASLNAAGIDAQRLASFDRSITHEPEFQPQQCERLKADLKSYLVTLQAVHGGQDLHSAALAVLGYTQRSVKGKPVTCEPAAGVDLERLKSAVQAALLLQTEAARPPSRAVDAASDPLLAAQLQLHKLMEARRVLTAPLARPDSLGDRLRDVLYLDQALEGAARTAVEGCLDVFSSALGAAVDALAPSLAPGAQWPPPPASRAAAAKLAVAVDVVRCAVENVALSECDNSQAAACWEDLTAAQTALDDAAASRDAVWWTLCQLSATLQRLRLVTGAQMSRRMLYLQPTCQALGAELGLEPSVAEVLAEDTLRGGPQAPLSQLLSASEGHLQRALGRGAWRVIAPGRGAVGGVVKKFPSLLEAQRAVFTEPAILVVDQVGGDEDIPEGVRAVLCKSDMDVLCHAAVRARATGALLACCTEPEPLRLLQACVGEFVQLRLEGSNVSWQRSDSETWQDEMPASEFDFDFLSLVPKRDSQNRWVVMNKDFAADVVGAKAVNTRALSEKLSACLGVPTSFAVPFGTFERVLKLPANYVVFQRLEQIAAQADAPNADHAQLELEALDAVLQMDVPSAMHKEVEGAVAAVTGVAGRVKETAALIEAVKAVWASKWNVRAWTACRQLAVQHCNITMSVLCQPLIAASLAFVCHTRDPRAAERSPDESSKMYIEVVTGLGESLVGNSQGSAMAFTVDTKALGRALQPALARLPVEARPRLAFCAGAEQQQAGGRDTGCSSLRRAVQALDAPDLDALWGAVRVEEGLSKPWVVNALERADSDLDSAGGVWLGTIARSDSNLEDLGDYSGAGVFNSVPTRGTAYVVTPSASGTPLADVGALRMPLLLMSVACAEVAHVLGGDQDVEGVIDGGGDVHIVQARPQVADG